MVTCSVVVFVLGLDLVTSLQVYIFAILSCTLCSIIGMICGLIWPMFDFISDVQVFKQSTAVGMNMLFSFISSIIPIGVVIYLNYIGESLLALIAGVFIYGLLIIIANAILKNVQNRFFKERDF